MVKILPSINQSCSFIEQSFILAIPITKLLAQIFQPFRKDFLLHGQHHTWHICLHLVFPLTICNVQCYWVLWSALEISGFHFCLSLLLFLILWGLDRPRHFCTVVCFSTTKAIFFLERALLVLQFWIGCIKFIEVKDRHHTLVHHLLIHQSIHLSFDPMIR